MHRVDHAWILFTGLWSAILVAYLVLSIAVSGRFRGHEKKRSNRMFWLVVVLAGIRMSARFAFGFGLIYRFAVIVVGVAAGIGTLHLLHALITQEQEVAPKG